MYKYDTYRRQTAEYIKKNNIDVSGKWSYQFGIYTGVTFSHIYEMFREYKIPCERIMAFDSFEGLPEEQPGIPRHFRWGKNKFNAKYHFQEENTAIIIERIMQLLPDREIPVDWIEGYFSDVLNDLFMEKYQPAPAFWLDIDVDLYLSAKQVLTFMCDKKLVLPQTIISYDDWGGTEEYKGGESLAHKEMCEEFGVICDEIHRSANGEHVQTVFIVRGVGE